MGERPLGTSLDRIDTDGDYCPENCKWSTPIEQAQNRRNSKLLSLQSRTQTLAAWARELNLSRHVLGKKLQSGTMLEEIQMESISDRAEK
jgi:hypothetical protein